MADSREIVLKNLKNLMKHRNSLKITIKIHLELNQNEHRLP